MPRQCNKCLQFKDVTAFGKDRRNNDGLQGRCTACKNEENRQRRIKLAETNAYKIVQEKSCNVCGDVKPIDSFYKDKAMGDGHSAICKQCKTSRVMEWRAKNKAKYNEGQRAYQKAHPEMRYGVEIKRLYGCSLEQYNAMLAAQDGACSICKKLHNPAVKKGRLFVDHCHETGAIRALLCGACNSMIGYANDDTRVLLEAAAYIVRHRK